LPAFLFKVSVLQEFELTGPMGHQKSGAAVAVIPVEELNPTCARRDYRAANRQSRFMHE